MEDKRNTYKEAFKDKLSFLRGLHRLTQENLSEIIGVTPQAVSSWERGEKEASFVNLALLADYFDVSMDYLVGRTEDMKITSEKESQQKMQEEIVEAIREELKQIKETDANSRNPYPLGSKENPVPELPARSIFDSLNFK